MKNRPVIIAGAVIIILTAAYFSFGPIAISIFSKIYGLEISYKELNKFSFGEIVFTNLTITHKNSHISASSGSAIFKPIYNTGNPFLMGVDLNLHNVRFGKSGTEETAGYDTLSNLVAIPFSAEWTYKEISGKIIPYKNGLRIDNLKAVSDDIKVSFTGVITYKNIINSDITIYFSQILNKKIPEELSKVVLRNEGDGWKSLSVSLSGDYATPSIQVSGGLFRLNIKSIEQK
jgi:hypothetical protein